jgi:ribose 5-phosphate isomerase RpiB
MIAIASDHAGLALKKLLVEELKGHGRDCARSRHQ